MGKIAISEFKAKCLAVIDEVNKTKKSVIITRRGQPIAELIPAADQGKRKEWLGSMKDTFEIVRDIMQPVVDLNEVEAYRAWHVSKWLMAGSVHCNQPAMAEVAVTQSRMDALTERCLFMHVTSKNCMANPLGLGISSKMEGVGQSDEKNDLILYDA